MNRTIEYQYSRDVVRRAAWHFMLRRGRDVLFIAIIITSIGFFEVFLDGNINYLTLAALFLPLIVPLRMLSYVKISMKVCDEMPDKTVSVTFTDDFIRFQTSAHTSEYKWSIIKKLSRFKTEWLIMLYSTSNTYTLIPTSMLDSELQDFILGKLKEQKTKII